MNPMLRKMKYGILFKTLLLGLAVGCSACRQPDGEPTGERRIRFELTLDARTRAPQALDTEQYVARLYLFREETADRYVAAGTMEITGEALTVGGLDPGVSYRFVFLAIPRSQQPALPMLADGTAYTEAAMTYLAGNQPGQEVFRAIQTFTAADDAATRSVVLTRQNGAIQIRLGNADGSVRNARLEVEALPEMLLQDGTGGQVLSQGAAVALAKSEQPAVTSDYRIAVNLLPAEDITGQGALVLTLADGTEQRYTLRSTSGTIPIYPNQITWLVLRGTGEGGSFEVGFGGDINLDDDAWDGYL